MHTYTTYISRHTTIHNNKVSCAKYYKYKQCKWRRQHVWIIDVQCESNLPWGFLTIFLKWLGIFSPNCTRSLNIPIYAGLHIFLSNYLQFWRSYAIRRDHPVHTTFSKCPPSAKTCAIADIFWHFPQAVRNFWSKFYTPITRSYLR